MYAIDASALFDGWTRWYPMDVMPTLWERIDGLIQQGRLVAPEEVFLEIKRGNDSLIKWTKDRKVMFLPPDQALDIGVQDIVNRFPMFLPERSPDGVWADPYVIALARSRGGIVVTGEKAAASNAKAPKIPNVCAALGVESMGFLELIRKEGWRW